MNSSIDRVECPIVKTVGGAISQGVRRRCQRGDEDRRQRSGASVETGRPALRSSRTGEVQLTNRRQCNASDLPSAHSPRIPDPGYATLATSRHAARTVSATTEEVRARRVINHPVRGGGKKKKKGRRIRRTTTSLARVSHERRFGGTVRADAAGASDRVIRPGGHLATDRSEVRRKSTGVAPAEKVRASSTGDVTTVQALQRNQMFSECPRVARWQPSLAQPAAAQHFDRVMVILNDAVIGFEPFDHLGWPPWRADLAEERSLGKRLCSSSAACRGMTVRSSAILS